MTEIYDLHNENTHVFKCIPCGIYVVTDNAVIMPQFPKDEYKFWTTLCPKCGKHLYGEYYN